MTIPLFEVKSWEKFTVGDRTWVELNIELPNGRKHSFGCPMDNGEEAAKLECEAAAQEWTKRIMAK